MTIINGATQHNVEDILASIRTSIADEGTSARSMNVEVQYTDQRRARMMAEEAADFELPAIFKPGHQAAPEKQKLLGRLSDALRSTTPQEPMRTRTVIPFEPNGSRTFEPAQPAPVAMAKPAGEWPPRRQPESAPAASAPVQQEVQRVMPTFFDTRISRLGEMSRKAYEPTQQAVEPPKAPTPPPERAPPALPPQRQQHHPMLPEGNLMHHPDGAVEDAAAQLLRPMLRQWLQENMPKIVEKALRSEAGDDGPTGPKRSGS